MKGTKYDISKKIDPSTEVVADMTVDSMAYNDVHAAYLVELVLSIINNAHEFALVMVKNDAGSHMSGGEPGDYAFELWRSTAV